MRVCLTEAAKCDIIMERGVYIVKKSQESSINNLTQIIKEITVIGNCIKTLNINSSAELRRSDFAQRICTQCITTIEANKRLLDDTVKANTPAFNLIELKRTRDISSHDYGSVDMNIVYRICQKLTDKQILSELTSELESLEETKEGE